MEKNLSAVQETWIQILGQEDPLEKGLATHSSILAWRIPWTEEPDGLQSMGLQRVRCNGATNTHTPLNNSYQHFTCVSTLEYHTLFSSAQMSTYCIFIHSMNIQ